MFFKKNQKMIEKYANQRKKFNVFFKNMYSVQKYSNTQINLRNIHKLTKEFNVSEIIYKLAISETNFNAF